MYFLIMFFALLMFIALAAVTYYNGIVRLEKEAQNAFSQIDVQLKRRYDLIPNLVETVKGYAKHESSTLEAVIKARNVAVQTLKHYTNGDASLNQVISTSTQMDSFLSKLLAISEAYPELKADTQFNLLMDELSSTENRIAYARQAFNDSVMDFNQYIGQIPAKFIASFMHKEEFKHLDVIDSPIERHPVKISF